VTATITAIPTTPPPGPNGEKPYLEDVNVDDLLVDERYQRPFHPERVAKWKKRGFSWAAFGTLLANLREDGHLWLIDGRHRLIYAQDLGIKTVPVYAHVGLTYHEEIEAFDIANSTAKPATAQERMHARLADGDPVPVTLKALCEAHGFIFADVPSTATRAINAVATLEAVYSLQGTNALSTTLDIIAGAWQHQQRGSTSENLLRGLAWVTYLHIPGDMSERAVTDKLATTTPALMKQIAANMRATGMGPTQAMYQAILQVLNKGKSANRLETRPLVLVGEDRPDSLLTKEQVAFARELLATSGRTITSVAKELGVNRSTLGRSLDNPNYR